MASGLAPDGSMSKNYASTGPLPCVFLQLVLQTVQLLNRPCRMGSDPSFMDRMNRNGVKMIPPLSPLFLGNDQVGPFKNFDMLHDRTTIQFGKMRTERARSQWLIAQVIQYLTSDR